MQSSSGDSDAQPAVQDRGMWLVWLIWLAIALAAVIILPFAARFESVARAAASLCGFNF